MLPHLTVQPVPLVVDTLVNTVEGTLESIIEGFPTFVLVVFVLLVGYLVARRARAPVERLVESVTDGDRVAETPLEPVVDEPGGVARAVGVIVQLYVLVFAVLVAAEVAAVAVLSEWAEILLRFVPALVGGGAIIVAGLILGDVVGERTRTATAVANSDYGDWIVAATTGLVYVVAIVIGLETVGFDLQIVYLIVEGIVSAIGLGIAAAIALAIGLVAGVYAKETLLDERIGE